MCGVEEVGSGVDVVYLFVFFFKQKTAYEMRISDWSSDVCSSDLHADVLSRNVPVRKLQLVDGEAYVATVFDLLAAHYGVDRGLGGEVATSTTTMRLTRRPGRKPSPECRAISRSRSPGSSPQMRKRPRGARW